ncbi:hypothetical protein ACWCQ1_11390 [Streptomyces sp. NPDC002144]
MPLLAVIIPLLMLGVVLALGRYEELLLPTRKTDRSEDAPAGPPGATLPLRMLPSRGPARVVAAEKHPPAPSGPAVGRK